ncbi:hypothetical protein GQX73_g2844 [Xylaria multiplex]|uniref:Uncharacterized protein n=1 Tax=Xylaria multiplex TaxID=323545 RepID=A0A7C8IV69_9PEZI|nr:hypothetical protein GQX73_g2844 [Xylaria multiplex]
MNPFPPNPPVRGYEFRKATKDDLDNITQIHIDGFLEEPMDNYCFPNRFEYMEDHFTWLRKEYEYYLDNSNKYLVHVAVPAGCSAEGAPPKPMALAVWNIDVLAHVPPLGKSLLLRFINTLLNSLLLDRGLEQRKDVNKKHVEAYMQVASKRYVPHGFFYKWGEEQITLSVLTVLPDFRRQGVATMMVHWGTSAASKKGWPVTVCASPMGQLLYENLKFVVVGTEVIQAEDEEDSFSSAVMVLHPGS